MFVVVCSYCLLLLLFVGIVCCCLLLLFVVVYCLLFSLSRTWGFDTMRRVH